MKAPKLSLLILSLIAAAAFAVPLFAHVSVNPRKTEAGGKHLLFFVRAPVEKEIPCVELGVEVDEQWRKNGGDLNSFQDVPGWTLHVEKDEVGKVKRVYWDGNEAEAETFQMFNISMNVPKEPGKYPFKSWQKYKDGSVVWWNEVPGEKVENPYPQVEVTMPEEAAQRASMGNGAPLQYTSLVIAVVALLISLASLKARRQRT